MGGARMERLETRQLLSAATQDVLSYHYDAASTGQDLTESVLTPQNVNAASFGKLFSTPVDGQIYAEPLYVAGQTITAGPHAGTHDVVFVATENDSLYAIDAGSGQVLWQDSFLIALPALTARGATVAVSPVSSGDVNTTDISPSIGITSTPAIDLASNSLFLTAKTKQIVNADSVSPDFVYTLYKVNLSDGTFASALLGDTVYNTSTKVYSYPSGPYVLDPNGRGDGAVSATINGTTQRVVYFNALRSLQRSAVTLNNGNVYLAFASHGDVSPYHGWILGFNASTLAPSAVFNDNPDGSDDGIWQGGGKLAVDAQGFMYFETGNGTFDTTLDANGFPIHGDYGDSFVKVTADSSTIANPNVNGWGLKVVDYFTPHDQDALSSADRDLGSGAPLLLPESVGNVTIGSAAHPDLLIGSGKNGTLYLIDRNNMGKFDPQTDHVVQEVGSALGGGGSLGTPGFFYDGTEAQIYYGPRKTFGKAYTIANGAIDTTPVIVAETSGFTGSTPTISADGTANGIVWNLDSGNNQLRAYSANDYSDLLYNTTTNAARDSLGTAVKFTVPTVANGQVFLGTSNALLVYGELSQPANPPAAPASLAATAVASGVEIDLAWQQAAGTVSGFFVEESSDGGKSWTQIATLGAAARSDNVTGLAPGKAYSFRVRAFNSAGNSPYSNIASATTPNTATAPSFSSGFVNADGQIALNGAASLNGSSLQLTDGGTNEAASAFFTKAVSILGFNTSFTFQIPTPASDEGFTFTIQGVGPAALGGSGAALGYSGGSGGGILNSIAIKFDLADDAGEGGNTTGLFVNGDLPTAPAGAHAQEANLPLSGIDLHAGDPITVALAYDGVTLHQTVTDTVTGAAFSHDYTVDIPTLVGAAAANVGFTASTGAAGSVQTIQSWTYNPVLVPPVTPANFKVTPGSGTELDLSWSENFSTVSNFDVLQLINGSYSRIAQVAGAIHAYNVTGLHANSTYSFEVLARNSAGVSAVAGPVSGTTPAAPANLSNLAASAISTGGVTLRWHNNATNATGITVSRQLESDNSQYLVTLPANATSYIDTGLLSGRAYDYILSAINLGGTSAGVELTVQTVPGAPAGLAAAGGPNQVNLSWAALGHAVTHYTIYRGTAPGAEAAAPIATNVAATIYLDKNLAAGKAYYYQITAVDTGGQGVRSAEVSAIPAGAAMGSISGTVFNDVNRSGALESGEPGLAGRVVYIDANNNGKLDSGERSVVADSSGNYSFSGLAPGKYNLQSVPVSGWRETTPWLGAALAVNVTAGQSVAHANFGWSQAAYVFGHLFNDANGNKIKDASESVLAGWRVYVDLNNNGKLDAGEMVAVTTSSGSFAFSLAAGTYTIRVVPPAGWTQTTPIGPLKVTVGNGQVLTNLLIGERKTS